MEWLKEFDVIDFGYAEEKRSLSFDHYENWVKKEHHFPLNYLADFRKDKRRELTEYWDECQSALCFLFSYHDQHLALKEFYKANEDSNGLKIASYTQGFNGLDYHHVLKDRLEKIAERLKQEYGANSKVALDVHPVLDRDLAYRSGLGWFGKNSMMINKKHGSFTIIASLLLDKKLPLTSKAVDTDHCGQCHKCADACPTSAIDLESRTIVAKDCISTFTIEQFKEEQPFSQKMDLTSGYIFGCDICQDVCPWNIRLEKTKISLALPELKSEIIDFFLKRKIEDIISDLESMSAKFFERKFKGTSLERSGKRGLLKNLIFYKKQKD